MSKQDLLKAIDIAIANTRHEKFDISFKPDTTIAEGYPIVTFTEGKTTFRIIDAKEQLERFRDTIFHKWSDNNKIPKSRPNAPRPSSVIYRKPYREDWEDITYIREYKPQATRIVGLSGKFFICGEWFGDGHYMVRDKPKKIPKDVKYIEAEKIDEILPKEPLAPCEILYEYKDQRSRVPTLQIESENNLFCIQAFYMDILKNRWPHAEIRAKKGQNNYMVCGIVNKQIVAIILGCQVNPCSSTI